MHKLYSGLLLAGLLATMGACKKDDPKPKTNLTAKEQLLTDHKWKISAITLVATSPLGSITQDGYAPLAACQKDNFNAYNADKTGATDEGATKCSTSAPQSTPYTWSFNAAETELSFTGTFNGQPNTTVAGELLQLTNNTMQVRTTTTQTTAGITITTTATTTYVPY